MVKIDRSLTNAVLGDDVSRAVIDGAFTMASALGIELVAEGVEVESQRIVLRQLGVDLMQGYLFRRPMPADALDAAGPLTRFEVGDQPSSVSSGSSSLSSRSSKLRALIEG